MVRAAAEIEPQASISSSRSILPGPMRPAGSRLILRLSDGMAPILLPMIRFRCAGGSTPCQVLAPSRLTALITAKTGWPAASPSISHDCRVIARRDLRCRRSRASRRQSPRRTLCRRSLPAMMFSALSPRGLSVAISMSRALMRTRTRAPTGMSTPATRNSPTGDCQQRHAEGRPHARRSAMSMTAPPSPRSSSDRRSSRCRMSDVGPDADDPAARRARRCRSPAAPPRRPNG